VRGKGAAAAAAGTVYSVSTVLPLLIVSNVLQLPR
jgi:hypothetical protein